MKNWEFYEEKIKENNFIFGVIDGEIVRCLSVNCGKCSFKSISCGTQRLRFLYQEHKEPIRLTDDEKVLCKLLGRGWIARDKNGNLYWYLNKPNKAGIDWMEQNLEYISISTVFPQCKFNFIKWEDEEPWEVKVND